MTPDELKSRTKAFALAAIRLSRNLPRDEASRVMSKQLVRCATSVGANYRSACLAKSSADMVMKLKIVEEEADESLFWLELLLESDTCSLEITKPLMSESYELFRIMAASIKTLRNRK